MDLENLPVDIISIIVQYCPAESIRLHTMSKSLRKAVLNSGRTIIMMHLFHINKYGYIWGLNPESNCICNFNHYFTDNMCTYMYKQGEPIKYMYTNHVLFGYIDECLKDDDVKSATAAMTICSNDEYNLPTCKSKIRYHLIKTGVIKYNIDDKCPYLRHVVNLVIKQGILSHQYEIIAKHQNSRFMYDALDVMNYDFADIFWNKLITDRIMTKILSKFIFNDNLELLKIFLKRYNLNIDDIADKLIRTILSIDAVKIFEYVIENDIYLQAIKGLDFAISVSRPVVAPKIAKFIMKNSIQIKFSFHVSYLFAYPHWHDIYIPSKLFQYILMIEQFYPIIVMDPKTLSQYSNRIQKMHKIVTITPHPYMFVNKLFNDMMKCLEI